VALISEVRLLENPLRDGRHHFEKPGRKPLEFHRRLPEYEPTPLRDLPPLAELLGVGRVLVKDESSRLGLPAFKMLGASWASYRAVAAHTGIDDDDWGTIDELAGRLRPHLPLELVAATDGNHGRAVARMAKMLGLGSRIWVPRGTVPARIEAIESEDAPVTVVNGSYDEAVRAAAGEASDRTLVVSDTSWEGYETVPRWVVEGYSTIFWEFEDQRLTAGWPIPNLVPIPMGVGALGAAVVTHFGGQTPPVLLGVEPVTASCVEAALRAGEVVTIPSPHETIMAGLSCGTASPLAFPILAAGLDWTLSMSDDWAVAAMRMYADHGVVAGETGAATLGAVLALTARYPDKRSQLGLGSDDTLLLLVTEGATDPENYQRLVGPDGFSPQ
jgi:diaminopropionate ammonia-lyase